jgi:hypothetical protein
MPIRKYGLPCTNFYETHKCSEVVCADLITGFDPYDIINVESTVRIYLNP